VVVPEPDVLEVQVTRLPAVALVAASAKMIATMMGMGALLLEKQRGFRRSSS
jgi:hypothetical protein